MRALLCLLATGAALAALGGCDDDKKADKVYASLEACQADLPADECTKGYNQSLAAHEASAPHYADPGSCEATYGEGQCVPRGSGGNSFFMPMMLGYMMGASDGGYHYAPVYVDRYGTTYSRGTTIHNTYVISGGTYSGTTSASIAAGRSSVTRGGFGGGSTTGMASSSAATGSVARGGFGATATAHASAGGGGGE